MATSITYFTSNYYIIIIPPHLLLLLSSEQQLFRWDNSFPIQFLLSPYPTLESTRLFLILCCPITAHPPSLLSS